MTERKEPWWIERVDVDALHDDQIAQHGGTYGVRDDGLILSALARPRNLWLYDETADLCALAAAYAFGLAKNHGYVDANKRVALHVTYVFLRINGTVFDAPEPEIVSTLNALADGSASEGAFADWLRDHTKAA